MAIAALLAVLGGAWLWLRDSSFVRVRNVTVTGVTSSDAPRITEALEEAARGMSTLHVRRGALLDAVAPYASVAGLEIHTDFPHGMTIDVVEHHPVAVLAVGARRVPATGNGLVLRDVDAGASLPAIALDAMPGGDRVTDRRTRAALAVAAAAPAPLLHRGQRFSWGPQGLTVALRNGPPLIFGDASHRVSKWLAAARVLAEPSATGATYLDLRIPGRVAAGGLGPVVDESPDGDSNSDPQSQGENSLTLNP